jgi:hypothetical protein
MRIKNSAETENVLCEELHIRDSGAHTRARWIERNSIYQASEFHGPGTRERLAMVHPGEPARHEQPRPISRAPQRGAAGKQEKGLPFAGEHYGPIRPGGRVANGPGIEGRFARRCPRPVRAESREQGITGFDGAAGSQYPVGDLRLRRDIPGLQRQSHDACAGRAPRP